MLCMVSSSLFHRFIGSPQLESALPVHSYLGFKKLVRFPEHCRYSAAARKCCGRRSRICVRFAQTIQECGVPVFKNEILSSIVDLCFAIRIAWHPSTWSSVLGKSRNFKSCPPLYDSIHCWNNPYKLPERRER